MYRAHKTADPRGQQPQQNLETSTIRSFEGGLNVIDTDLNMSSKYAKTLDNFERGVDGSLSLRPGTKYFTTVDNGDPSDIVNDYYFNGYIITVQVSGRVSKVDGTGVVTHMLLSGSDPWTAPVTFVSFSIFSSDLIICNGRDKPLLISGHSSAPLYMELDFLQDLATLSNVNTPIGSLICAHAQYVLIAGIPTEPSTLYISNRGSGGTWVGDPAPNDSVAIDLGPRVSIGSATITGLVAYRDKIVVTFERGVLPMNLGVYTGSPAVHTPSDDGFIEEFGCLAHRSMISIGDDTYYVDNIGVNSIERISLFNTLRPRRVSALIDPAITALIQPLTPAQIAQYVFSVYDLRNFRYMLFVPVFDDDGNVTETVGFSYTDIPVLKIQAWAKLRGWVWQCACRTALQNIVFARGNKLYTYDYSDTTTNADRLDDPDINDGAGESIEFDWELPWSDLRKRMNTKKIEYLGLDTQGTAQFTVRAYVDNLFMHAGVDAPLLTMNFVGGSIGGYGNLPYGDAPFGSGRPTSDERLYAFPYKCKIFKLRFSGSTKSPLRIVSISIAYTRGTIRR